MTRTLRNYDGPALTTKQLNVLSEKVLLKISHSQKERPDVLLAAWSELVGPQIAARTNAVSFCEGVLLVKVHSSTLFSILSQREKPSLLAKLRKQFPQTVIRDLRFRIG